MKRILFLFALVALAGCGGGSQASPAASTAAKPAASGDWQKQWDDLVAAAKKEGKVALAVAPGGGASAREVIPPAFKQDFGIDVEVLVNPSIDMVNRLKLESSSGLHTVDVAIGGADTMYQSFYGEKLITPAKPKLIHPDAINPARWTIGHPWFMDPEGEYILRISSGLTGFSAINTKLLNAGDFKSWQDFIKPEYKGKIATFDPTINGAGSQHAAYLAYKLGPDYIKKLYVDQTPQTTRDQRQLSDWVARGNYPIGISMSANQIERLKTDGLPVVELAGFSDAPGYMTAGSGLMAEIKDPPHPAAAQLFLNWMAMDHGQTVYNKAIAQVSPLTTVKSDWVPDYVRPKPGVDYVDSYSWDYTEKIYPENFRTVRRLLGAPAGEKPSAAAS